MWDPDFDSTVPADGLAPSGARPSAGTVLTEKFNIFSSKFLRLSMILHHLKDCAISVKITYMIFWNLLAFPVSVSVITYQSHYHINLTINQTLPDLRPVFFFMLDIHSVGKLDDITS